jgi:hypothetical protein
VATKVRALSTKSGERPATTTAAGSGQLAADKATAAANGQIKALTDLATSLLKAMEGQKLEQAKQIAAREEQKKEHANQIKASTRMFTEQIER